MIIEYNVYDVQRILTIKFPEGCEPLEEEILDLLDKYYDEWCNLDITECPEKYMIRKLSETHNMWIHYYSVPYGKEEEF